MPRELVELAAILELVARSCQDMTTVVGGSRTAHHNRMADRLLITRSEAAERLGVSVRTVDRLSARGQLPFVQIERLVRFRVSDVEAYVQSLSLNHVSRVDPENCG